MGGPLKPSPIGMIQYRICPHCGDWPSQADLDKESVDARLAAVEHNYADVLTAQVNLLQEVADLKNQVANLSEGVLDLVQRLTAGGYLK